MNTSISKNIKRLRQQAGMTQEQMAEKLFVTRQTVSLWENGKTQPDIQTLEHIAECFDVDLMTVLYGAAAPKSEKEQHRAALIRWGVILLAGFVLLTLLELLTTELYTPIYSSPGYTYSLVIGKCVRLWLIPLFLTERGIRLAWIWSVNEKTLQGIRKWGWLFLKCACFLYFTGYWLMRFWQPDTSLLRNIDILISVSAYYPWGFILCGFSFNREIMILLKS